MGAKILAGAFPAVAGELAKYAQHNIELWKNTGVKTVVTPCADCFQAFRVLYEKNAAVTVPIASITKLMTVLVFLETRPDLDRSREPRLLDDRARQLEPGGE